MKIRSLLSAVLSAALLLSTSALAAEENPVVFTYNGREVRRDELVNHAQGYVQNGLIESETDYDGAIAYMIRNQLAPEAKAHELGLDVYTDEELAAIKEEADAYFEQQIDAYADYYGEGMDDAAKQELKDEIRGYWADMGTTIEVAEQTHLFNKTKGRLIESMEVTITEEEIEAVFAQQIAKDEDYFKDNVKAYEYYTYYRGSDVWYRPEGFRRVQQILLPADEALTSAYTSAKASGEGIEAAREAVIDSQRETIDAVYAELSEGIPFAEVMVKHSKDPQLESAEGDLSYEVHPESSVWVEEFTQGAFSDKMQKIGDVSDPIVSSYGVHILYYLEDIPAGAVGLDDRIRESITAYLTNVKQNELLDTWAGEYELVINDEALDALKTEAAEAAAAAEAAQRAADEALLAAMQGDGTKT